MVPSYASAAVLVMIGAAMFRSVATIDLSSLEDSLPAFLTVILIPLTFSITQGILWGFVSHVLLYLIVGRRRDIHPVMFGLAALAVVLLIVEHT
jgi:AGZA family xanthine/uracil permease-like MFS transporter